MISEAFFCGKSKLFMMDHISLKAPIPCVKASTRVIQLNRVESFPKAPPYHCGQLLMVQCGDSTALGWRGDLNFGKNLLPTTVRLFCMI